MNVMQPMSSYRRAPRAVSTAALLACLFCVNLSRALADGPSQAAVHATPAEITALNLGLTPSGTGVRVAVAEAGDGITQLSPANANMPAAGTGSGQINIVAGTTLADHATFVTGVIMEKNNNGIAPNSIMNQSGGGFVPELLLRSQTMITTRAGGNSASILNWSWHNVAGAVPAVASNGTSLETRWADWAAIPAALPGNVRVENKVIVVAGNETASNTRFTPWDNYNGITVGATSTNNYTQLATYNGVAGAGVGTRNVTTDASPYGNGRVGRLKTDIVAPGGGDGVVLASPVLKNGVRDTNNDGLNDNNGYGGTSFAAPHVAGGAALLTELGVAKNFTRNELVLKSVLLNGADKTGLTDHNGAYAEEGLVAQTKTGTAGANQPIYIGWDSDLGTGLLDVSESLREYNAGQFAPGPVPLTGWDLNEVGTGGPGLTSQWYDLNEGVEGLKSIRATLSWNRLINLSDQIRADFNTEEWNTEDLNGDGILQPAEDVNNNGMTEQETFSTFALNDLDLEIWNQTLGSRTFFSSSDMDSIEHVDWLVPIGMRHDDFAIRVLRFNQFGSADDRYGLAWTTAVPEPGTLVLMALGGGLAMLWGRRRANRAARV